MCNPPFRHASLWQEPWGSSGIEALVARQLRHYRSLAICLTPKCGGEPDWPSLYGLFSIVGDIPLSCKLYIGLQ